MRQIKFRAWDKKKRKWLDRNTHVCVSDGVVVLVEYRPSHGGTWEPKSCRQLTWPEVENLEIVGFTGRHDKNGKEIYEGDIVRKNYGSSSPLFTVAYHEQRAAFIQKDGFNDLLMNAPLGLCEIIGNIYENGDLLV